MATTPKVLGQSAPVAATLTDAYTVPALTRTTISSIMIANRSGTVPTVYRISVAVAGAADDVKQYIFYDNPIQEKEAVGATLGITLGPADVVRVYALLATVSFNIFGIEEA